MPGNVSLIGSSEDSKPTPMFSGGGTNVQTGNMMGQRRGGMDNTMAMMKIAEMMKKNKGEEGGGLMGMLSGLKGGGATGSHANTSGSPMADVLRSAAPISEGYL